MEKIALPTIGGGYERNSGSLSEQIVAHDTSDTAHAAIRELFKSGASASEIKAALTELGENYKDLYTLANTLKTFLESRDTADETINTWREIEDFLNGLTDRETLTGLMEQEHQKLKEYTDRRVEDLSDTVDIVDTASTHAFQEATKAQTMATAAQTTADAAKTQAYDAYSMADSALDVAEGANETANMAASKAENAQVIADTAQTKAELAAVDAVSYGRASARWVANNSPLIVVTWGSNSKVFPFRIYVPRALYSVDDLPEIIMLELAITYSGDDSEAVVWNGNPLVLQDATIPLHVPNSDDAPHFNIQTLINGEYERYHLIGKIENMQVDDQGGATDWFIISYVLTINGFTTDSGTLDVGLMLKGASLYR